MTELFILPFDHRNSFIKVILGVKGRDPTEEELDKAKELKLMIYEGFKRSIKEGVEREHAGILTDEWLGLNVLRAAKDEGYAICLPVEKSGQKEFHFYKEDYKEHIIEWNPDYVKVLVRYNPKGDGELNKRQRMRLAELCSFLKEKGKRFMLELLVPPTEEQKDSKDYDNLLRPGLASRTVEEMHKDNIYPDVWKIEGFDKTEDMQKVADKITENDPDSKIIILGRGENMEHAEKWLKSGAKVESAIGFAIGRTIFQKPLEEYMSSTISKDQAINKIKENYMSFIDLWKKAKSG